MKPTIEVGDLVRKRSSTNFCPLLTEVPDNPLGEMLDDLGPGEVGIVLELRKLWGSDWDYLNGTTYRILTSSGIVGWTETDALERIP